MSDIDEVSKQIGALSATIVAMSSNIKDVGRQNEKLGDKVDKIGSHLIGMRADHDATVARISRLEKSTYSHIEETQKKNEDIEKALSNIMEGKARLVWLRGILYSTLMGALFFWKEIVGIFK